MEKEIINDKRYCCPLCGTMIEIGEKCTESTWELDNGEECEVKTHTPCFRLLRYAHDIDYSFELRDWIDRYLYNNHYDNKIDDIETKYQNMTYPQLAEVIYKEKWEDEFDKWSNVDYRTMDDIKVK